MRFDEKRLTDLPASGQFGRGGGFRDVFGHALSAPGVSQLNSGNVARTAGTNFSVNGSRLYGNNFMIDGQDSNEPSVTGRHQVLNNPDIVQELRVVTNQFLAEHGRNTGSVVSVITKSGTNDLHGSAFWFYNSNALNTLSNLEKAAGFAEAPFINEHQFGGTAGGPIKKDSTFAVWLSSALDHPVSRLRQNHSRGPDRGGQADHPTTRGQPAAGSGAAEISPGGAEHARNTGSAHAWAAHRHRFPSVT